LIFLVDREGGDSITKKLMDYATIEFKCPGCEKAISFAAAEIGTIEGYGRQIQRDGELQAQQVLLNEKWNQTLDDTTRDFWPPL